MEQTTILIVDDDRALRTSVCRALELEGYATIEASDGEAALWQVINKDPQLVVLDLGLPGIGGLAVCQSIRSRGYDLPILVLTARSEVQDRVEGLDAGADDFMTKPFALDELFARVRALLRRHRAVEPESVDHSGTPKRLVLADLEIDQAARRVWRGGTEIELTKTEFDLLEFLVVNEGVALSRSTIYQQIWGYDFGQDSKTLAVYIGYLRSKIEADGSPMLIHTVRGVGYCARER
ncbi:MAG: response regulator transcription factor [Actinobacteria bacterium]|nr:response regulator transcription factor [Actinomycetota bacterium]